MNSDRMNFDRESRGERVPLPGFGDSAPADPPGGGPGPARGEGIRHVRRMSNWTAAALIVGTGAATVALAHQAMPASTSAAGAATAGTTAGTTAAGTAAAKGGPSVGHSVATTTASGVTVTTTTRTVNGKTIVTHTRSGGAYHDD
jgi:hypothetical protein